MQASTPELRPLSVGEVLDVAIKIFFRNAATLFAIVLPIVLPVQLLSSLVTVSAEPDDPFATTEPTGEVTFDFGELWLYLTAIGVVIVLAVIASTLATGACFKGIGDAYLGERPTAKGSLGFALRRVHSIVWVTFLGGFLALLPLLGAIVLGIGAWVAVHAALTVLLIVASLVVAVWLYISFAVAVPVLLMEGVRGRRALGRSRRLVKGRWWATFGIIVLGSILAGIVSFAITTALEAVALTNPDNEPVRIFLSTIGGTLASTLTTPFQAAFVTVLYFDLRVRKEGFDLQLLAERIGLTPRTEGAFRPAPAALPPQPPVGGEQPPYWPPPPGWTPSGGSTSAARREPDPDQPPYWPPPPEWKPRSEQ